MSDHSEPSSISFCGHCPECGIGLQLSHIEYPSTGKLVKGIACIYCGYLMTSRNTVEIPAWVFKPYIVVED